MIFLALLLSVHAQVGPCHKSWEHVAAPLSTCRLEWAGGGVELVLLKDGCGMEGGPREDCAILRECGAKQGGDLGASQFRRSSPASSYCLKGKEVEVFAPADKFSPRAFIVCTGIRKPQGIRLQSPDGKHSKTCPFPFTKP